MSSVDRRRAHLRVGIAAVGVFAVLLAVGLSVASAALPVAIALFAGAAVARLAARPYLESLAVWCMGAVVVYVVARIAAGGVGLGAFALAVALGGAALLVWLAEHERPAVAPRPMPEPEPEPEPPVWTPEPYKEPARLWSRG